MAVIAASCLTLEYGVSGAAVARTRGDKVLIWIQLLFMQPKGQPNSTNSIPESQVKAPFHFWSETVSLCFLPENTINIPACFMSLLATWLFLTGLATSKMIINSMTVLKILIVVLMAVIAFCYYDVHNMPPFVPAAPYGLLSIARGATKSFFGFIGYDEVCCVAGEALDPKSDIPRAIVGTIVITTGIYVITSMALTGLLLYTDINPTIGFPDAFLQRHITWAATWTAMGELITLPIVVVLCLLAQPRLNYCVAMDGILPIILTQLNEHGNLSYGIMISGILMTFIATFCPFTYLDD